MKHGYLSVPLCVGCLLAMIALMNRPAWSQAASSSAPYAPNIATASDAGERAIKGFRVAPGLKVELFAAEPMVANPVSLCIDGHNRVYVAETFRYHAGVTDIRRHMNWLNDDLAARTVADRLAMYRKYLGRELEKYSVEHDRIRLIEDRNGDGKADDAKVYVDGFHGAEEGFGAGVLARRGALWYTCIPRLWQFRDRNGDGAADERKVLHDGYGVHVGFLGHDMHGLRMGPDGKLYYSIGDRGLNVRTADGRSVVALESGSVLRCNPDGSELEVFATGLRNPQELAFDEHGNLFTCDNNSDGGDKARWVYVVEAGDSGWRIGYQFIQTPVSRGPWNAEKLWEPAAARGAAYMLPPLANISDGPSGLTYDPGTGLPDRYRRHFFLCDFRGTAGQSGIRSFANKADGGSFKLVDAEEMVWGVLATDADFGTDGALYVTDWVEKFSSPAKGRIYRITAPSLTGDLVAQEVKTLLADGMERRSLDELAALLAHRDGRVRQEAQFALADRKGAAVATLARIAKESRSPLARLHAIWALGQIGAEAAEAVVALLDDSDAEVRAQAAKVSGDRRLGSAYAALVAQLLDESLRVRFFAAMALGKLGRREATGPLLAMLRENGDRDAYLLHAGVMGLTWIGDLAALRAAADDPSASARLGVLLAMRRLGRPEVARFLDDPDSSLVLEAARAINDVPIDAAMPKLAALTARAGLSETVLRRALNANLRLGGPERAEALVELATGRNAPTAIRAEALDALGEWADPPGRDPVVGLWRPVPRRPAREASDALAPALTGLLSDAPDRVRQAAARSAGRLAIRDAAPLLAALFADARRGAPTRIEALKALEHLKLADLPQLATDAADDPDQRLQAEGLRLLAIVQPDAAIQRLSNRLDRGPMAQRQGSLRLIGSIAGAKADEVLSTALDRLLEGQLQPELALDLLEASQNRADRSIREKRARYEAARPRGDVLAAYREALAGGHAPAGRQVFFQKAEVSCLRCHKIGGQGGEVGPDLSGIGAQKDRLFLLESIVAPDRKIADGFETRVVATADGQVLVGVFKAENSAALTLMTPEGKTLVIPKADIEEQKRGSSAMPDDLTKFLSKSEIRDLVEFLASQKKTAVKASRE